MKNKFLAISIIFILISFTFINSCFASSYPSISTFSGITAKYKAFCIYTLNNSTYAMVITADEESAVNYANFIYGAGVNLGKLAVEVNSGTVKVYKLILNGSSWSQVSVDTIGTANYKFYDNIKTATMHESSKDIKNQAGGIFFPLTLLEKELTMAEIMKTAGEQAHLEVGQIILIVITTTAGLMVLLIGLKKGLTVLMNGFRH